MEHFIFWGLVAFGIISNTIGYIPSYKDLMVTYQVTGENVGNFHCCTIQVKYAAWSTHDVKGKKIYDAVIKKEGLKLLKSQSITFSTYELVQKYE